MLNRRLTVRAPTSFVQIYSVGAYSRNSRHSTFLVESHTPHTYRPLSLSPPLFHLAFPRQLASKPTVFRLPRIRSFSLKKHGVRSINAAVSRLVSPRLRRNRHGVPAPKGTQWGPYVCGGVERAVLQRGLPSTSSSSTTRLLLGEFT